MPSSSFNSRAIRVSIVSPCSCLPRGTPHPSRPSSEALVNQHLPGRVAHAPHRSPGRARAWGVGHGPAARVAGSVSSAVELPGAAVAVRLAGCKTWPQIHQGLVGVTRPQQIKQGLAPAPEQGVIAGRQARMGRQARQQPFDVAVRIGNGALKALERMLPAVVRPMPGKAIQPSKLCGHGWPTSSCAASCGRRVRVIPQALPLQPHRIQRRRGQGLNGGKHRHPAPPVGSATANWVCCSITSAIQMP